MLRNQQSKNFTGTKTCTAHTKYYLKNKERKNPRLGRKDALLFRHVNQTTLTRPIRNLFDKNKAAYVSACCALDEHAKHF